MGVSLGLDLEHYEHISNFLVILEAERVFGLVYPNYVCLETTILFVKNMYFQQKQDRKPFQPLR